jgi:hypothetical protein
MTKRRNALQWNDNKAIGRISPWSTAPAAGQGQSKPKQCSACKELLNVYEQASRAWLARMQSEVELWTGLATRLSATRSLPEALGTYQECVAQRMQMAAEDGRRMTNECQKLMQTFSRSPSNGSPTGST